MGYSPLVFVEMADSFAFKPNECYEQMLTKHEETLFKLIDLHHLLKHLSANKVVTEMEKKRLCFEYWDKPDEAKKLFFDILIRKGFMVFKTFLKALKDEKEHTGHATPAL